jgi:acetyl-CoA carboxylase carboxyl transferase subunit alpha
MILNMSRQFLEFEQPIEELKQKIEALRMVSDGHDLNLSEEISKLEEKSIDVMQGIFSNLSSWQITQMARHPMRPQTLDYIERIFTDFTELHGDRHCSSAPAIVGGLARFQGQPVIVLGHQKGKKTSEKVYRNFGMARPEEYRKALRLMKMAEKFKIPVITFIDTAGAYPGIDAEERNQSEAIARNLYEMAALKTPIICIVTGEAGSGGALAIGVGDYVVMLEYSIYSVISPEGCASILWKDASRASEAAEAMGVTAKQILEHHLVDEVLEEPLGGAHRDLEMVSQSISELLQRELARLQTFSQQELVNKRYEKWMAMGACP